MIGGMKHAAPHLQRATMAALDLATGGDVPEWVHLMPTAQGEVQTQDARGPYIIDDAAAIIAASFADQTKLQIDENHAEDLRAGKGEPSPARGWITAMEARADGIWGRVEWTEAGRTLVADKAYRAMSPVILHDKAKKVFAILRASLVNRPNFRGLAALNQEQTMDPMAKMAAALGLAEGASADDILAAIRALKDKKPEGEAAMQSALADIGVAFGLEATAPPATILAAAKLAGSGKESLVALQSQVTGLTAQLTALQGADKRSKAEAFIDKAIADCRAGISAANREDMIALHMSDAATAEKLVNGMPMLTASGTHLTPPTAKDGTVSLNAEQIAVCAALGVSQADFLKTLAEEKR
jgi:phage I-like protein